MKILVTFALENEFAPWRKMRRFRRASVDNLDQMYEAEVGSADVRVVLTGAGRFAAQRSLGRAFDYEPDMCIACGLAGALKPDYRPGAVLAARATVFGTVRGIVHDPQHRPVAGAAACLFASGAAGLFVVSALVASSGASLRLVASKA